MYYGGPLCITPLLTSVCTKMPHQSNPTACCTGFAATLFSQKICTSVFEILVSFLLRCYWSHPVKPLYPLTLHHRVCGPLSQMAPLHKWQSWSTSAGQLCLISDLPLTSSRQGSRCQISSGVEGTVYVQDKICYALLHQTKGSFFWPHAQGMLDSDAAPAVVPIQPMQPHGGMSPQHQSEPGQTTWGQDGVQWAGQAPTPHPPQAGQQLVHGACVGAVGPPPGPPLPIPILPRAPGPSPRGQAAQIPRQATGPMQGPMKATALPTTSASAHGAMHILPAYPTHPAPPQPLEAVLMHALSGLQLHTGMNIGLGEGRGKGGSEGGSRRGGAGMWDRHSSPGGMGGSEV